MIRIQQMKLKPGHAPEAVEEKAARILRIPAGQIASCSVAKQSIDARKKPEIWYSYVVDITLKSGDEDKVIRKCRNADVTRFTPVAYHFPGPELKKCAPAAYYRYGAGGAFLRLYACQGGIPAPSF